MIRRLAFGGCVALVLAACGQVQQRPLDPAAMAQAYQDRAERLQSIGTWSVEGRLAISDGQDGGSGRLSWKHQPETSRISFRGALGQGAWELQAEPRGARLEMADGRIYRAATVGELAMAQVGWKIPVEALSWWLRGLVAPPGAAQRELDGMGRLTSLQQLGWSIEFGHYLQHAGLWLPSRLTARRDAYSVKLAVREWALDETRE